MNYTYTEVDEFYDGTQGGDDAPENPTPGMVSAAINDGRSITSYCGHGNPAGWGTSGFSNSDIENLVNDNKLPYVICVACNNGQFNDYDECFCEAWLRATNNDNGESTGAIAATGSSKGMSWAPPMDAQDEMIDLIVETYSDNVKHTIGGIHANGCMHMNDEYGPEGWSETDTWHIFGDPSLQIRTDTPSNMTVSHKPEIGEWATTFEVNVPGVEGALCAISQDCNLLGYAYTDETGHALIEFNTPINGEEPPLDLVVTAYNKITYTAQIIVTINTPPNDPTIDGPSWGVGKLEFTFVAIDSDNDDLYYYITWGDGASTGWFGTYPSGEDIKLNHTWSKMGVYTVSARAKDIREDKSSWTKISVWIPIGGNSVYPYQSIKSQSLYLESVLRNIL